MIKVDIDKMFSPPSGPKKKICGKIIKDGDKRIGGPRNVCIMSPNHTGKCTKFKWMLQVEHAEAIREGIEE